MAPKTNITEFWRECPKCGEKIYYGTRGCADKAKKRNLPCIECGSASMKRDASHDHDTHPDGTGYDPVRNCWVRHCADCTNEIVYTSFGTYRAGVNNNALHFGCSWHSNCTDERLEGMSKRMTEMQLDPTSAFHTPEAEQRKSESLKRRHRDPSAVWNTPKWRAERSRMATERAQKGEHPFQNLSDESIVKARKHSAESMMAQGFVSRGERALADALQHWGFVLNEFKVNIGRYFPDIMHHDKKIIVEYLGDYYHANPNKYEPDEWNKKLECYASDIWDREKQRTSYLEEKGWEVIHVWETDWLSTPAKVIELIELVVSD